METQDNRRPGGCSESGGARAILRPHWIAVPTSQRLSFRALRNGSAFGTHDLTFSPEGASLKVETNIEYAFKVGFVTLFRYKLRGLESWVGNVLTAAQAKTDNNGAWAFMTAERTKDGLIVDGSQTGRYRAPDGALIASHWNIAQLNAPMINPQDGTLLRYTVASRGLMRIVDTTGSHRVARHFGLKGENPFDLWYDGVGVWTSLKATVGDGSIIRYVPVPVAN